MVAFEIIAFFLLFVPTVNELRDDRFGDSDHTKDVYRLLILAVIIAGLNQVCSVLDLIQEHGFWATLYFILAIHFFVLDYAIARVLGHQDWFSYLSNNPKGSKIDRIAVWVKIGPWGRFIVKLIALSIGVIWYF